MFEHFNQYTLHQMVLEHPDEAVESKGKFYENAVSLIFHSFYMTHAVSVFVITQDHKLCLMLT